jgi:hypothetical protein
MYVPSWSRQPSGLVLPIGGVEPAAAVSAAEVPLDVRPPPRPVALEHRPPAALDQFMTYIDEELLEYERSSLARVRALIATLPAEPALALIASLAARVRQLGFAGTGQLGLAKEFYGPGVLVDRMRALVAADSSRRVFADQQIQLLLWLLIVDARDAPSEARLSGHDHAALRAALLGCTSVVGDQTRSLEEGQSLDDLLGYFVQLSTFYRHEMPLPPLVRAQELLRRARDEIAQGHPQFCPLDSWHQDTYGLDLDEQLRLGIGLSAMAHAWHQHDAAGTQVRLSREAVDDFMLKASLASRTDRALSLISATRAELTEALGETARDSTQVVWEGTPLKRFPFLRCNDGGLTLLSPAFIQSWLTDGFHYRSLLAAQTLDRENRVKKARSHAQRYLNFIGAVYERYCLDLARSVHPHTGVEAARVLGEQPFSKSSRQRAGRGERTSDIAVEVGPDLVLVEITASRIGAEGQRTGDTATVARDLDRSIVDKINQLDNCVNQLVAGHAQLPGVQMPAVERIWPVIVSFGAVSQNPVLWDFLDRRAPSALRQARVRPLTLLDPEEYEALCALIEAGHPLPTILSAKTAAPYTRTDFAYWLHRDPHAPRSTHRAQLVEDSYRRAMANALAGIDFGLGAPQGAQL